MKITIITEYFPYSAHVEIRGGVEARCFYLGKELAKRHKVTIITSWSRGAKREDTVIGMRVVRIGPHHPYTQQGAILSRLRFARAAKKAASSIPADIIDGTNFISYLPAFAAAQKQRVPAVATYHEVWLGSWIKNKGLLTGALGSVWERLVLAKPWNKIIAVSKFTKQALIRQGIAGEKITIVPNGVDLSLYREKESKERQPTICCISRLTPQKRVEDLVRAFALVKEKLPKAQCVIVGVGDEEECLLNLTTQLGLHNAVKFLGFVKDHKMVIQHLKKSHVFCLPSVVEGFGIVILEAMAAGVPYVCTDIVPLREITDNGKGGLLCKQKDPESLAQAMLQLLTDKQLYAKKAQEAARHVKQYEWGGIARQLEKAYGDCLQRKQGRQGRQK